MAPPAAVTHLPPAVIPENKTEEVTLLPQTTKTTIHPTLDFQGPGLFGPDTGLGEWNILQTSYRNSPEQTPLSFIVTLLPSSDECCYYNGVYVHRNAHVLAVCVSQRQCVL